MESLFDLNWPAPDEIAPLSCGESHLWSANIDQPLAVYFELKGYLSTEEQVRAARLRNEKARQQFILSRGLLRKLIGHYLDEHPSEVSFVYGDHGKPLLFHPVSRAGLHFNVSHAGDIVLLGFALGHEIGVDVEQVRSVPEADAIAQRFFTSNEVALMHAAGANKRDVFFRIWTRKEALLKCTGTGFGDPLPRAQTPLTSCEICPAPGYIGAVAVASTELRLQTWRWSLEIPFQKTPSMLRI